MLFQPYPIVCSQVALYLHIIVHLYSLVNMFLSQLCCIAYLFLSFCLYLCVKQSLFWHQEEWRASSHSALAFWLYNTRSNTWTEEIQLVSPERWSREWEVSQCAVLCCHFICSRETDHGKKEIHKWHRSPGISFWHFLTFTICFAKYKIMQIIACWITFTWKVLRELSRTKAHSASQKLAPGPHWMWMLAWSDTNVMFHWPARKVDRKLQKVDLLWPVADYISTVTFTVNTS